MIRARATLVPPVAIVTAVLAIAMVSSLAAPAAAQAPSARDEFVLGQRAADESRWSDALAHFRRAYELSRNPVALHNVAATLRLLGRYVEARDALGALLTEHEGLALDLRREAQAMRADVEPRIARLELEIPDVPALTLVIDGAVRAAAPPEHTVELDPGEHALVATAPGHAPFQWHGALAPGQTRRVAIELAPAPADRTHEHWAIGLGIGGGVLVLAAVVAGVAVALHDAAQLAPRTDVVLAP